MYRLTSLTLMGLLAVAQFGCSDDDDPAPGGTSGSANAGSSGAGGSSAGSGMGGSGTSTAGTDPGDPPFTGIATCSGCVEVAVPVSGPNSAENVLDQVGYPFYYGPGQDFSNVTVTWRVMALENNPGLMVAPYAENGDPYPGVYGAHIALSEENFPPGEWVDVVFDLARVPLPVVGDAGVGPDSGVAAPDSGVVVVDAGVVPVTDADAGGDAGFLPPGDTPDASVDDGDPAASAFLLIEEAFDKRDVEQLGLYVGSNATLVGDAVARVAIDSVTFTGTPEREDITFDTGLEGLNRNGFNEPPGSQGPLYHP